MSHDGRQALAIAPVHEAAHAVRFYQTEEELVQAVTAHLVAAPGVRGLVIATPSHAESLRPLLKDAPVRFLDAAQTLQRFMVQGMPDPERFRAVVGAEVGQGPVRAFGEMVALLCEAGNGEAAVRLESLWSALCEERDVALLCAYPLRLFAEDEALFRRVLGQHPTLHVPELAERDARHGVLDLQRRVLSLQSEAEAGRAARQALARHEVDLRDFMENAVEGLHQVDGEGRIVWANAAELAMLGYGPDEYIGQPVAHFHADAHVIDDIMTRLARGESLRDHPARLRAKDGSLRHVRISTSARMENGRIVGTRCFTRDVTDSHALESSRRAAATLVESMAEVFLQVDRDWRIVYANPAARQAHLAQSTGRSLWELFAQDTEFGRRCRLAMEERQRQVFEAPAPSGAWHETTVLPVDAGIWICSRDVTKRRDVAALLEVRSRQQAAVASLGQAALAGLPLETLYRTAVEQVSSILQVELTAILRVSLDSDHAVPITARGWGPRDRVPLSEAPMVAMAMRGSAPVVTEDFDAETRFQRSAPLLAVGVRSGIAVAIRTHQAPCAVLTAYSRSPRRFSADDVHFVEALSHLLAAAIERSETEAQLHARNEQQATVARIGHEALTGRNLQSLLDRTALEVSKTLGVEFCKILELDAMGENFLLRSGVGWKEGLVGRAVVPADARSQGGYAMQAHAPVVVLDLAEETRFEPPQLLRDHGVASGMTVLIKGRSRPFGVLGVHSTHRRVFTADDVNFLQSVAHLLAAAIDRRRIEEELVRHRDHLEDLVAERTQRLAESNQELEAFNYSVSHDLRTPLRAIAGFSGLLAHRHARDLQPNAQRLIAQIQREAVRMGQLIEELLNLSRFHRVQLARAKVDVSALAEEVLAGLSAAHPQRQVDCIVEKGLQAEGDPHLLRVVLENLLGNAWKFTAKSPKARIEVLGAPSDDGLTVCVRDNGAGFDMAYAQKLFQPFQRLHSPLEFEGTGIGLATVARILQRHGGKVWAESRVGEGASFYFTL